MADKPVGGEDDWVKQMLAEAMLGRPAMAPAAEPIAAVDPEEPIGEPVGEVVPAPTMESVVRFKVVLDEPVVEAEPLSDDRVEAEPVVQAEPLSDDRVEAEPVVEPTPAPSGRVDAEPHPAEQPEPASTSRLFERPNFDATNDPGVDEMLDAEHSEPIEPDHSDDRTRLRSAVEWLIVLGSAVVVALLLRAFLFQAFFIPSESMEATLRVDDRVLVNKLSYRIGDVQRGEVVVFRRPDDQPGEFRDLIKRVIGLPGESIEATDNTIFIDGRVLIEPYLTPGEVIGDFGPVVIPEGEYFVMGDNRDNSGDSRVFGTVDEDRFIGRAFFLFWPLDRIGSL